MSKKNIGATLALYPCPVIVVGAMVNDKPTWTLVAHAGTVAHPRICRDPMSVRMLCNADPLPV